LGRGRSFSQGAAREPPTVSITGYWFDRRKKKKKQKGETFVV